MTTPRSGSAGSSAHSSCTTTLAGATRATRHRAKRKRCWNRSGRSPREDAASDNWVFAFRARQPRDYTQEPSRSIMGYGLVGLLILALDIYVIYLILTGGGEPGIKLLW